jgi:asparagine synthase (glutamine-hydrolysing)
VRDGEGKWALRQVLYRHVPKALVDRPKMGFSVPLAAWLRGPLRSWAEACLCGEQLASDGVFEPGVVRLSWSRFLRGDDRDAVGLWAILQFQEWRSRWLPAGPVIDAAEAPGRSA